MAEIPWLVFIAASLVVIVAPGQDLVLVMSRGLGQGSAAGVTSAAGVSTGLLGHTALAALGLGALISASQTAFLILKIVGGCYLVYLGIRAILSARESLSFSQSSGTSLRKLFVQGALSNISNAKIVLFYFAYLPQFVPASVADPTLEIALLGSLFALLTFIVKAPVGFFSGQLSHWINNHPRVLAWINRLSGGLLIGLGLRLALAEGEAA